MELHIFVNRERENLSLTRQILARQRSLARSWLSYPAHDEVPMEPLCTKLGIEEVAVALRTKRLSWYGHVARASSWTNSITSRPIAIPGPI